MKARKGLCLRCETVGRKPGEAKHKIEVNDTVEYVCDECMDEIDIEIVEMYEIKEDEDTP